MTDSPGPGGTDEPSTTEKGGAGFEGITLLLCENPLPLLLAFAAGSFVYIASSDLIPEIKGGEDVGRSFLHFAVFVLGVVLMLLIRLGRGWVG